MTPLQALPDNVSKRTKAQVVVQAGFLVSGIVTPLLGPILPILIARWTLSDERAGIFFTLQFFGNLLGVASLGSLIARKGFGKTLGIGFGFIALGVAALNFDIEIVGLIATAGFGYGLGLVLSGINLWVAEVAGSRRANALTLSNLVWGIGAMSCPALVMFAQRNHRLNLFFFAIAGMASFFAIALALMNIEPAAPSTTSDPMLRDEGRVSTKLSVAMGLLFFLYCGTESAVGGWIASFANRVDKNSGNLWELAPMFFWAGLLSGRIIGPLILRRLAERRLLIFGLILAAASSGGLLLTTHLAGIIICVVCIGLGFACVFPLLVSSMVGIYGLRARSVGSKFFAMASIGSATIPWAVGFISTLAGNLRAGLFIPLFACSIMLSLLGLVRRNSVAR